MFYPLTLDVYYSTSSQNDYGELVKEWVFDRTERCRISSNTNYKDQNVFPEQRQRILDQISAQIPSDVRRDTMGDLHSLNDILITNVGLNCGGTVYIETTGQRKGLPTNYEIIGYSPHVGALGRVDYVKIVLNRMDDQGQL